MNEPHLAEIWVYPIKSLDGIAVRESSFVPAGGLAYDRQWALFTPEGKFVNAKSEPQLQQVRSSFALDLEHVTLEIPGTLKTTIALNDLPTLSTWFSAYLKKPVAMKVNMEAGFPDDVDAPGPTVISRGTLLAMAEWFPGVTVAEMCRRLRPNLVLDGVVPFAEDCLVPEAGRRVPFTIGAVKMFGMNPCQRCVVPSRNPESAEVWPQFQVEFARQREQSLPAWAERSRFNHYYRAAVNTQVETTNRAQRIAVGDLLACDSLPSR